MADPCFVYKRMAFCLGHVLVLSRHVTPPPYQYCPHLISFSLFNPLAVLCRYIVNHCALLFVRVL